MSTQASINKAMADIVETVRLQMFAKKLSGLENLNAAFQQVDWSGSGIVTRLDFNDVLNYVGMFLSEQNLTTIQKFFAQNPNNVKPSATIPVRGFMEQILVPLTTRRSNIVDKAWSSLSQGNDTIDTNTMISSYNAANHVYVRQGTQTMDEIMIQFSNGYMESTATKNDFIQYYTDLSATIPRDSFFVSLLEDTWSIKEVVTTVNQSRMIELATLLKEKVRQKEKDGKSGAVLLKYSFDFFDVDDSNKLTRPEFYEACAHFGLQLSTKDLDDFFYLYGTPQNTITITAFAKDMYNGAFENKINPPTDNGESRWESPTSLW